MGDFIRTHANILVIVGVVLLLGLAGVFMMRGQPTGVPAATNSATSQQISLSQQIERELLNELLHLREINLDNTLFTDQAYTSLVDFSREIAPQPIGRENPFAPIENVPGVVPRGSVTPETQTEPATTTPEAPAATP